VTAAIPPFTEAVLQMRRHLAAHNAPEAITWVFRDDVLSTSPERLFVLRPVSEDNPRLTEKVFGEGAAGGLVEIVAIATHAAHTLASVWYPKFPEEEVQGWAVGMKLVIRTPLPRATAIPSSLAWVVRLTPAYRRFNPFGGFIGDRAWARATAP
jgi:hypothetical protein